MKARPHPDLSDLLLGRHGSARRFPVLPLARSGPWEWGFRATRTSEQILERAHSPRVVELDSRERPEAFSLVGLEIELGFALDELVRSIATQNKVVGLSVTCEVAGEATRRATAGRRSRRR